MTVGVIIALVLGIPFVLVGAAFIWYINVSGIYTVIRETQKRRVAQKHATEKARL